MSEDEQYFTVDYYPEFGTSPERTVVKAADREEAEAKFKRENPHVQVVAIGGGNEFKNAIAA